MSDKPSSIPATRRLRVFGALVGAAGLLASCASGVTSTSAPTSVAASPGAQPSGTTSTTTARGSGPVDVLYAGSLVDLMEKGLGPEFDAATGYSFQGRSGNAGALANEIKGKTVVGDVFIGAAPANDLALEGSANGNWASWYATFAQSPLVIGYNPASKFAQDFKTMPWYKVLALPGILVGRTDPATDPKGALTVTALKAGAAAQDEPALTQLAANSSSVYPENTLVGRLQAGQLDAGFFYSSETTAASIPAVPVTVPGQKLQATYTITVVRGAPDQAGADAFVAYLLGPEGRAILKKDGFDVVQPPTATGTGVPAGLQSVIPSS